MLFISLDSARSYAFSTASWVAALNLPGFALLRKTGVSVAENLYGPEKNRTHTERRRLSVTPDLLPGLVYPPNTHSSRFIRTKRGIEIHVQSRIPTEIKSEDIKAVVCLCHGYADSGQFMQQYLQAFLLREGYAVVTVDYEGHGHSSGLHVYVSDFHGIVDDCMECFDSEITRIETSLNKNNNNKLKRFLCGESMGGGVALCLSLKQQGHWDGVVLCAAMCRIADHIRPHPIVVKVLKVVEPIVPWLAIVPSTIGADCVHRCPEKREQSKGDPFRYGTRPRLRSALNLLYATEFIEANMSKVQAPLLILHGKDDLVTDPECSKILHAKASSTDKTIKMYDSVWHSFGGEPEDSNKRIQRDIGDWLKERATAE